MHSVRLEHISFGYDAGHPVLRDITLAIPQGEFFSLLGPNGSGKTTLLRLIDRILLPDSGEITLFERSLGRFKRTEIARRVAFVPQENSMVFPFTVAEVVLMGRAPHLRGVGFEGKRDRAIAWDMMERTDILGLAHRPVTSISGGERQRAFIARALTQESDVLLLDEPNAHLDISHVLETFSIIKRYSEERHVTVISVSHDLNLAACFSHRVSLLSRGTIFAEGTPTEVLTESNIREVFNAAVLVDRHPLGLIPRITLLPEQEAAVRANSGG